MIFLGIDPGTAVTGYGILSDDSRDALDGGAARHFAAPSKQSIRLIECGVLRTRARDPLSTRLREIHDGVTEIIARHGPHVLAVESVFYGRNVRTTVSLGHARGVILLAGEQAGLAMHEFTPAEIKKSVVGTGAATKEQVQFMIARLLRLRTAPTPSDAADGVAAALACIMSRHLWRLAAAPRVRTRDAATPLPPLSTPRATRPSPVTSRT